MDLLQACNQAGILYKTVPCDDNWHQTGLLSKANSDAGRIYLFSDGSGGMCWNWTTDESITFWHDDQRELSPAEKWERSKKQKAAMEKANADREKRYAEAAELAEALYVNGTSPKLHAYLERKHVKPSEYIRELPVEHIAELVGYVPKAKGEALTGNVLIIPIASDRLQSVELIDEHGRKSALAGGKKKGGYWLTDNIDTTKTLYICEGVATALSIREATQCPVAAVLSCGNFAPVIAYLRGKYPSVAMVICSDIGNGSESAKTAADEHGLICVEPVLESGTDFNDMHVESGLDAVRDMLLAVAPKRRIQFQSLPDMIAALPDRIEWQVENFIEAGSTVCFFGASEQGKSFIVADLAMSIATGHPFAGMNTAQGNVLILVGEGRNGFLRRLQAWCSYNGFSLPDNVYLSAYNVDIYKPLELPDIHIDFIVCDTLAQHYEGDENDASSMMAFLARMELIQRKYRGSTVCIVHHSGTQSADRGRGSTALRAALDAEFKVAGNVLACSKMKDFEHPPEMYFRLESEGRSAVIVWGKENNTLNNLTEHGTEVHRALLNCVAKSGQNRVRLEALREEFYRLVSGQNYTPDNLRKYLSRGIDNLLQLGGCDETSGTVRGTKYYSLLLPQDIELTSFKWINFDSGTVRDS